MFCLNFLPKLVLSKSLPLPIIHYQTTRKAEDTGCAHVQKAIRSSIYMSDISLSNGLSEVYTTSFNPIQLSTSMQYFIPINLFTSRHVILIELESDDVNTELLHVVCVICPLSHTQAHWCSWLASVPVIDRRECKQSLPLRQHGQYALLSPAIHSCHRRDCDLLTIRRYKIYLKKHTHTHFLHILTAIRCYSVISNWIF